MSVLRSAWSVPTAAALLALITPPAQALDVVILDDGGANTPALVALLEAAGHSVLLSSEVGLYEYQFNGTVDGAPLNDHDAVIWLDGGDAAELGMSDFGQSYLSSYLMTGGGLVHFGDTSLETAGGAHGSLGDVILLSYTGVHSGSVSCQVDDGDAPAAAPYSDGDTFSLSATPVVAGSSTATAPVSWSGGAYSGQPAVMTAEVGSGRVTQFAWMGGYTSGGVTSAVDYGDANVQALLLSALEYVVQRPPTIDGGPFTVDAEATATLSLAVEDPDGGPVTCGWDLNGDDDFSDDEGSSISWTAAGYDGPTVAQLWVRCTDDEGVTASTGFGVTIDNVPPTLTDLSVSGDLEEGSTLTFDSDASDIEGDRLSYLWDFGDGETSDRSLAVHTYADDGDYTVLLTVEDADGAAVSRSEGVTVANVAPSVSISGPVTARKEGDDVQLTSSASDPGDDTLSFLWDFGDGETSAEGQPLHVYHQDGSYTVELIVTDDEGASGADSLEIAISNAGPSASIEGPTEGAQGELLELTCIATDPGDDALSVTWNFDDGETAEGETVSHAWVEVGDYQVNCLVSDGSVNELTSQALSIVNAPPQISAIEVGGGEEGAAVSFSGVAEDPGGDALSYSWDFGDGDGASGANASHTYVDDGDYTVTLTVSDGTDEVAASADAIIENVAPTLSGAPSTAAYPGVPYRFTPVATDPGADSLSWSGSLPSGAELDAATGELQWTPELAADGTWSLEIIVTDDDGGADSLAWEIAVSGEDGDMDGLPDDWERSVGLDPSDPDDAAADPDGDGRSTLEELEAGRDPFTYGGPGLPVPVSPLDGEEVVIYTPEFIADNTEDGDGDALVYRFELYADEGMTALIDESGEVSEGSGQTRWSPAAPLAENTALWWRVSAWDGWTDGGWSEPQGIFVNAVQEPPGAPTLIRPWEDATVEATAAEFELGLAEDPDGDALSYYVGLADPSGVEVAIYTAEPAVEGDLSALVIPEQPLPEGALCWYGWAVDEHELAGEISESVCFLSVSDNQPPSKPAFIYPAGGDVISDARPAVQIADGVDPEGGALVHRFELDTESTYDSPGLVVAEIVSDGSGSTTWTMDADLASNQEYFLRALADDGDARSSWAVISFSTRDANQTPSAPLPSSPGANEVVSEQPVNLIAANGVDPEGGALLYDFEVYAAADGALIFTAPGVPEGAVATGVAVIDLVEGGGYSWRVRCVDEEGAASDWSELNAFSMATAAASTGAGYQGCGCAGAPARSGGWLLGLLGLLGLLRRRD